MQYLLLVISSLLATYPSNGEFTPTNSAYLDANEEVLLEWSYTMKVIKLKVTAPTSGWIGIGFSPSGTMTDADIIFAWMQGQQVRILDMHSSSDRLPRLDRQQSLLDSSLKQNGTHSVLYIDRYLDTCDRKHDFAITEDTTRVIYAYGGVIPTGDLPTGEDYHGQNRGVKSLRLLDKKLPVLDVKADKHLRYFDVKVDNFRVPNDDTYYHCTYHKLPKITGKQHIVQFEAVITPGNEKYVHHMTMYHCNESLVTDDLLNFGERCYYNDDGDHWKICTPVVIAWAVGMTEITFPDHVGYAIGTNNSPKVVKLEIHYDNVAREKGIIDSSGIRIYHTPVLRQHDAGILLTGHEVYASLFIPPGSKEFTVKGHCTAECLGKILEIGGVPEINVFGVFLHSHTAGKKMILHHYRNKTELSPIGKDMSYDFDFQETKLLANERTVKAGDSLVMECVYDTSKRKFPTIGGLRTRDEMCFGFAMYYPKLDDAFCQSSPQTSKMKYYFGKATILGSYLAATTKKWTDEDRRIFNKMLLATPFWQLCKTLDGRIEGLHQPHSIPFIRSHYVEDSGMCDSGER